MSTQKLIARRRRGSSGASNVGAGAPAAGAEAAAGADSSVPAAPSDEAETPTPKGDAPSADGAATAATDGSDSSGTPNADNLQTSQQANTPETANLSAKTGEGKDGAPARSDGAPASVVVDTKKADPNNGKPNTRMRTRSLSSARSSPSKGSAPKKSAKSQQPGDDKSGGHNHRTRSRSRARSLSSALSSISGGDSAGDSAAAMLEDDGKTPLRANRGPAKKRHKKKGPRTLFKTDTAGEGGESLPPPEATAVSFAAGTGRRARSDTIDSFRAAMDSLPADGAPAGESIVLPARTDSLGSLLVGSLGSPRSRGSNSLASPRRRADTVDFLTTALGDGGAPVVPGADDLQAVQEATKLAPRTRGRTPKTARASADHGKTPKITNRTRGGSQSSESRAASGPLRKRHRTRSLSFADEKADPGKDAGPDETATHDSETNSAGRRSRSNTLGSHDGSSAASGRRPRSDTLDFLTAAVAGDVGHDLDAAADAAAASGASFAMHPISAPSGATAHYHPRPIKGRPRSDTLDSAASSINSAKLDFLVSVAAEHGPMPTSPVVSGAVGGKRDRTDSTAASDASSLDRPRRRPRSNTLDIYARMASDGARPRGDTVDFLMGAVGPHDDHPMANLDAAVLPGSEEGGGGGTSGGGGGGNVMDHLEALCAEPRPLRGKRRSGSGDKGHSEEGHSAASQPSNKRRQASEAAWKASLSQEQTFMDNLDPAQARKRLESWGGMSDLSTGLSGGGALAATHTALRDTGIFDDVLAAAADLGGDDLSSAGDGSGYETKMRRLRGASGGSPSIGGQSRGQRPRKDSLASLSLASLSDASISVPKDKQKKATAKEAKTPAAKKKAPGKTRGRQPAPRASKRAPAAKPSDASASTPSIVVDYDAIASAVQAANAATEGMDLATILGSAAGSKASASAGPAAAPQMPKSQAAGALAKSAPTAPKKAAFTAAKAPPPDAIPSGGKAATAANKSAAPFPVTSVHIPLVPIPKSTKSKEEMDAIRARARAAAGYVPPGREGAQPPPPRRGVPPPGAGLPLGGPGAPPAYRPRPGALPPAHVPLKKRGVPLPHPHPPPVPDRVASRPGAPPPPHARPPAPKAGTLQSQQKWDDMFAALVRFIAETREKHTRHLPEPRKSAWIWDGNVPTSYKTPEGKALGRWINNQRSAKVKGTLKDEREVRLVSTGLKWCVLTTNSWKQMLHELEVYVQRQTKDGRVWDGNVPTNYKIARPASGRADDEGKNLGRWVNRQRSLYQAGKLKKERQEDLERIGLKWSVLLTTPWSTMYDALCVYAEERKRQSPHGRWDGQVPATYKTKASPPLSLGRWVHRQRNARAKGRLKEEHVRKLEATGLSWQMTPAPVGVMPMVALSSSSVTVNQSAAPLNASAEKAPVPPIAAAPPPLPPAAPTSVQDAAVDTV
ncbi:hypothetical protein ACHAXT_000360 [Thalassiosira profunda]